MPSYQRQLKSSKRHCKVTCQESLGSIVDSNTLTRNECDFLELHYSAKKLCASLGKFPRQAEYRLV